MALEIAEANPNEPIKLLIYGIEGIGKTTLGAKSDSPIFIAVEGRVGKIRDENGNPIKYFKGIKTFDDVLNAVQQLKKMDHGFKTIVLDSADWIEKLCHAKVLKDSKKPTKSIITTDGGYGAGYRMSQTFHSELISELSELSELGMNIIITAHYHVREVRDPEMPDVYDAYEIKCHEYVSSLWREWVDCIFFARFETFVKPGNEDSKTIAQGTSRRIVFTEKRPSYQAKNCYKLPNELEFTEDFWKNLKAFISKTNPNDVKKIKLDQIKNGIFEMCEKITDESIVSKIKESVANALDEKALSVIHSRVKEITGGSAA